MLQFVTFQHVSSSALLADTAPNLASRGVMPLWIAVLVLVAAAAVGAVFWLRARARAALRAETQRAIESGGGSGPRVDPLTTRKEVEAPVTITESMSLREIKEARAAKLTGAYIQSDASAEERERRKGRTGALPATGADAVSGAPSASASAELVDGEVQPEQAPALVDPSAPSPAAEAPAPAAPAAEVSPPAAPAPAAPVPEARTAAAAASAAAAPLAARAPDAGRTLADGLQRTRTGFASRLGSLFSRARLDSDTVEELEEVLLTADIGPRTSEKLLKIVQDRVAAGAVDDPAQVWALVRAEISRILSASNRGLNVDGEAPRVVLVVGVNGAGKTTTIGKLAARYLAQGKKVAVIAGDTYRAAAVDQLAEWGKRVGCEVYTGEAESDPSGVIFEGLRRAREDGAEVVFCDTAGRLQTKKPLMDELGKIGRAVAKAVPGAPHETLLVLDANTGQNAIHQARLFSEVTPVTGIVLTKLDGTAKGGVVIGISDELGLPIFFVGIGEAIADLREFDPREFAEALF